MSDRLTSVLQDLHDVCGATVADLTPDEIEALVFACKRMDSPYSFVNAELIDRPIFVSPGVYLWPITAGAHIWLTEYVSRWWDESDMMYRWARVYALVNARDPNAFASLTDKDAAKSAIIRCGLKMVCHVRELKHAVNLAYGIDEYYVPRNEKTARQAQTDFSALVARLEVNSGIPAKSWLWGRSARSLIKSYVEMTELAAAMAGTKSEKARHELDDATGNLARVCARISERLKAKRNEQDH